MNQGRMARLYEVLFVFASMVTVTAVAYLTVSFETHPHIYYTLFFIWTLFLAVLLLAVHRKDIEIDTRLHIVRFAYLSAIIAKELRTVSASMLKSNKPSEVEEQRTLGFRALLNFAHDYYSFVKNEHCTADIALIIESPNGERMCRIIQYDDFVPNARRDIEIDIPIENSLFGEIIKRDWRAITIDDYAYSNYPVYITPIIEAGYCLSGICVPIRAFDRTFGFFNIDSMKKNLFTPAEDERIAAFFGELIGHLIQETEYKLQTISKEHKESFPHTVRKA